MPRLTYGCSVIVFASMSIEELTVGWARSASTAARETNGRYDREDPVSFLNRSLCLARTRSTLSKSTSTDVHTDAAMACEDFIPAATARRMRDSSTTWSRGSPAAAGAAGRGVVGAGAGAGVGAGAGAAAGAAAGAGAGVWAGAGADPRA